MKKEQDQKREAISNVMKIVSFSHVQHANVSAGSFNKTSLSFLSQCIFG